jgi:hypothetical protein
LGVPMAHVSDNSTHKSSLVLRMAAD